MTSATPAPSVDPAKAPEKSADRIAFDKAIAKNAPAPVKTSPPEKIWDEGRAFSKRVAESKEVAAPAPAPAPESSPVVEDDNEPDEEFDSAKTALRNLGFRKKHLDTMDRAEILSRGSKAIKRLEADAEAHRIAKEWREAQRAPGKVDESKPDSQPAKKPLDLKPVIGKLRETLSLDDAGAETLRETFEQFAGLVSESTAAPLREELTKFQKAQEAKSHMEMLARSQAEVGKSFPDLLDPETFAEVTKEAVAISGSKQFERYATPQERATACIRVACTNLGLKTDESDSKSEERTARRDARPTISDRARPTTPTTQRDADWQAYRNAMNKHGL